MMFRELFSRIRYEEHHGTRMPEVVEPDRAGKTSMFEERLEAVVSYGRRAHDAAGVGREDEVGILPGLVVATDRGRISRDLVSLSPDLTNPQAQPGR